MNMVGHQTVRVNLHPVLQLERLQRLKVILVVRGSAKTTVGYGLVELRDADTAEVLFAPSVAWSYPSMLLARNKKLPDPA